MAAAIRWFIALATVVSVVALAGFAQNPDLWVGKDGGVHVSRARAAAVRYCNSIASTYYPEVENQHNRDSYYRACMAAHGQLE
jgi:hypothetical protein